MIVVAAEVLPIQSKKEYEPEEKDGQDSTVLSPLSHDQCSVWYDHDDYE